MKKLGHFVLSTILVLSAFSCNRFEELNGFDTPDANEIPVFSKVEAQSVGKEYNALGVSKKKFSLFFKSTLTDLAIKKMEEKYQTKFKKIIPEIGVAVVEKNETDEQNDLAGKMKAESTVDTYEPVTLAVLEKTEGEKINDPESKKQYHLDIMNADKAWDITMGKASIKVAIVDSGVDFNHPDLKDRIVSYRNLVDPAKKPFDDNGHGTHVAGIVAATADNGLGVAGVAPECSLMIAKALKYGKGSDIDIADGIVWAAKNGADVINISVGLYTKSTAIEKAVKFALSKNAVVVSSAGNDAKNSKIHMPSMAKGVIEVSATTKYDKIASFSNFGQQISVSAPGDKIISTMPTYEVDLTAEAGKNYGALSGTSMASPMVAGLAALLKSQNKTLTPAQIKTQIEASTNRKSKYDSYLGYGRIDLLNAVSKNKPKTAL